MAIPRLMAATLLVLASAVWSASAPMTLPGTAEVSPLGAASYTVPLQVPPGVADLQPQLALRYDSRLGNGLLGVGWSLSGLPAITRCGRTRPQDGVKGAVAYDVNDRFCLDGKRLMLVSGAYGAAGSTYRAEVDGFDLVTALGATGIGPQSFVVKTRAGLTLEFGNTVDSRVPVAGVATVRVWALSKVSDPSGNYQSVRYIQPSAGSYYPASIDYTGNAVTGLQPTNSIVFGYVARPDALSGYQAGYRFSTDVRLNTITTTTDGATVLVYTLVHEVGMGGRSRIAAIRMCSPSNVCAPETSIRYDGLTTSPSLPPIMPVRNTGRLYSSALWFPIDVNGDGRTDLVHIGSEDQRIWTATGSYDTWIANADGTFTVSSYNAAADLDTANIEWQMLDVTGDGLVDLVHMTKNPGDVRVWRSVGDGTFAVSAFTTTLDTALTTGKWHVLDVDGDGRADLVHLTTNPGDVRVWRSQGDGTFAITAFKSTSDTDLAKGHWLVQDVNGDGLADLLHFTTNPGDMRVWTSQGDGTFVVSAFFNGQDMALTNGLWRQVDANADGLTDLVHLTTNSGDMRVWLSKGNGSFAISQMRSTSDLSLTTGGWNVVDVNGDGLADLVHTAHGMANGEYWQWESNGDGTFTVRRFTQSVDADPPSLTCTDGLDCYGFRVGDFLGSGMAGFVRTDGRNVRYMWQLSERGIGQGNLATHFGNGLGGATVVTMKSLATLMREGRYTKELSSDGVAWTVTPSLAVVASIGMADQSSMYIPYRFTDFAYDSARLERDGRGFLGFNWIQSREAAGYKWNAANQFEPDYRITTRNRYRTEFPFTGQVREKSTGSGESWDNLTVVTTEHECLWVDTGDCQGVAPGRRYFVYPARTTTRARDLDGTPLPGSRVENRSADHYGNIGVTTTRWLNADGSDSEKVTETANAYYNDPNRWIVGRLVRQVVSHTGPTVPDPVIPGSGNLPPAPPPRLPAQFIAKVMPVILQLLMGED